MPVLMATYDAVKSALEQARNACHIGPSLQSTIEIHLPETANTVLDVLRRHADELDSMFVVSGVRINQSRDPDAKVPDPSLDFVFRADLEVDGVKGYVEARPTEHAKCPRCWRYVAPAEDIPCDRCEQVMDAQRIE
jgi:isoleucyl-tRNA synthetase